MNLTQLNEILEIGTKFTEIMKWSKNEIKVVTSTVEVRLYDTHKIMSSSIIITKNKNHNVLSIIARYETEEKNLMGYNEWEDILLFMFRQKVGYTGGLQSPRELKERIFHLSLEKNVMVTYDQINEMYKLIEEFKNSYSIRIELIEEKR